MAAPGSDATLAFGSIDSPVGRIGVLADDGGLRRVSWGLRPPAAARSGGAVVEAALAQLEAYFAGGLTEFRLPYDLSRLTPTTQAVLTALAETVAFGETITYGELARRSGTGIPPRGIGAIMGSNPVPIVIGCHRVLAADGLGGFSGGDPGREHETKIWFLEHEGVLTQPLW